MYMGGMGIGAGVGVGSNADEGGGKRKNHTGTQGRKTGEIRDQKKVQE